MELPHELIFNIALYLDVVSLLFFKNTCKTICDICPLHEEKADKTSIYYKNMLEYYTGKTIKKYLKQDPVIVVCKANMSYYLKQVRIDMYGYSIIMAETRRQGKKGYKRLVTVTKNGANVSELILVHTDSGGWCVNNYWIEKSTFPKKLPIKKLKEICLEINLRIY